MKLGALSFCVTEGQTNEDVVLERQYVQCFVNIHVITVLIDVS